MYICKMFFGRTIWVLLATLGMFHTSAFAAVTMNVSAGELRTAGGAQPMPTSGLVILVASTNGTQFGTPTAASFVSGGNIEVARWDLSAYGPGGLIDTTGPINLANGLASGQAVAIYWFPTLTKGAVAPGGGTPYGFYRDPVANGPGTPGTDFSAAWYIPSDGFTVSLLMLTTAIGGSLDNTNGWASRTVVSGPNNPPVANTDYYNRTAGLSLKIAFADLVTNDTDADLNPLSVTGISAFSTNGVPLSTNSTFIFYPETAPNVEDEFNYTLSDGQTNVVGKVHITVVPATGTNSVVSLQVGAPGAGTNTVIFAGIPGYPYVSAFATNVLGPWIPFSTNNAGTNGLWMVLDTTATNAMRFYRSSYQP